MKIKPYIIIPNLIIQPTWGGYYISKNKNIQNKQISSQKIGQSYELYEFSNFSSKNSTENHPSLEIGNPSKPQDAKPTSLNDTSININSLIKKDPLFTLGSKMLKIHGKKMNILIKFTQAKGNSYQIHIKQKMPGVKWVPKPESWYFLEPGLITLGIKENVDWENYHRICTLINEKAKDTSLKIRKKKLIIKNARNELRNFINKHNPEKFVNRIKLEKNQAVDLSACGIHHSWEENSSEFPLGNIVYEAQVNAYDPNSVIRSFDKGKIKEDGSIRTIHVDEYFKYVDRSEKANNPDLHFTDTKPLEKSKNFSVTQVLSTKDYSMQEISIKDIIKNNYTQTNNSFHHLFVRDGKIIVETKDEKFIISRGFSLFVPANCGQYLIRPYKTKEVVILKTYI